MNRAEKTAAVEAMNLEFQQTPHVILASFRGLTVNQAGELRNRIREAGGRYRVIKNRLAKRAAAGTPAEPLAERFNGPCGIAAHDTDPVSLAKAMSEFVKSNPEVEVLGGLIDAKELLEAADVKRLASLPGIQELRAQLLAMIATPATTIVRLLGTPGTQLARVLDARGEAQGESEGAAETPNEE